MTQSARQWRRDRMIERLVARRVADGIADAVAQPAPLLVGPGRAGLLNARHLVPAPDAPVDRRNAGGWHV